MTQFILLRRAHNAAGTKVLSIHDTPGEAATARTDAMQARAAKLNADRDAAHQAGEASEELATQEMMSALFFVQSVG